MYPYISTTPEEEKEMLESLGMEDICELFDDIPKDLRLNRELNLPSAKSELEVLKILTELSNKNSSTTQLTSFLGAGAYDHYIPTIIDAIISRSEYYTSYTPYQPEISQGTLRYIFEYQTLMCELTGMDISNASLYDGGSSVAEGALMALNTNRKEEVLISKSVNPSSRRILKTYAHFQGLKVTEIEIEDGVTSIDDLKSKMNDEVGAVILQSPNFFGILEDLSEASEIAHSVKKCSMIASVDPISLGIMKKPSEYGVDIVVGESQGMGIPLSFGGPYLGFITAKKEYLRKMPGRIVGETTDLDGKRSYVLTLTAREQHIRREKATSNICSNQGLNVLVATIYMATMGKKGLREVALQSTQKAHYLYDKLLNSGKFEKVFDKPFFKEFPIKLSKNVNEINKDLIDQGFIGGYDLAKDYSELENCTLLAVTEKRTKEEMDKFVEVLEGI